MLTETTFGELCQCANSGHETYAIEILSPHEVCITYKQGVPLGQVAGEQFAIGSWMDFPILVTVGIIRRLTVDAIVEARQVHRKEWKDKELKDLEKLRQGQYDLQEEIEQITAQKEILTQKIRNHDKEQVNLLKAVEQLTEKVTKLESQPLHPPGFMTSSSQNVSNFRNLSTSFQVKADIDI